MEEQEEQSIRRMVTVAMGSDWTEYHQGLPILKLTELAIEAMRQHLEIQASHSEFALPSYTRSLPDVEMDTPCRQCGTTDYSSRYYSANSLRRDLCRRCYFLPFGDGPLTK